MKNARVAENGTVTYRKCKGALERPQRIERVIPRRQRPPSPLSERKKTEKDKKFPFQHLFFDTREMAQDPTLQYITLIREAENGVECWRNISF